MKTRNLALLCVVLLTLLPLVVSAQEGADGPGWRRSIGLGLIALPTYAGDDRNIVIAVPDVRVEYGDRFSFSIATGVSYGIVGTGGWRAGPVARYEFGRTDDGRNGLRIGGSGTDDLRGLGDIDGDVELGAFAAYTGDAWESRLEVRRGTGGPAGTIAEAGLERSGQLQAFGRMGLYGVGPTLKLVDARYDRAYFGIDGVQAAASGLDVYDAGAGPLSYGAQASLFVPLGRRVSVFGSASYDRLAGDAADSSLVRDRGSVDQFGANVFLVLSFRTAATRALDRRSGAREVVAAGHGEPLSGPERSSSTS